MLTVAQARTRCNEDREQGTGNRERTKPPFREVARHAGAELSQDAMNAVVSALARRLAFSRSSFLVLSFTVFTRCGGVPWPRL
jgi:hypothetical protein